MCVPRERRQSSGPVRRCLLVGALTGVGWLGVSFAPSRAGANDAGTSQPAANPSHAPGETSAPGAAPAPPGNTAGGDPAASSPTHGEPAAPATQTHTAPAQSAPENVVPEVAQDLLEHTVEPSPLPASARLWYERTGPEVGRIEASRVAVDSPPTRLETSDGVTILSNRAPEPAGAAAPARLASVPLPQALGAAETPEPPEEEEPGPFARLLEASGALEVTSTKSRRGEPPPSGGLGWIWLPVGVLAVLLVPIGVLLNRGTRHSPRGRTSARPADSSRPPR